METKKVNGYLADKTFVMLNDVAGVTSVGYYEEKIKDEFGKKHIKKHSYFNILFGSESAYSIVRVERLRDNLKPSRDTFLENCLVVYTDEPIPQARLSVLKQIIK